MLHRGAGSIAGLLVALIAIVAQLAAAQFPIASTLNSWWGNPQQMYPTTIKYAEALQTPSSSKGFKMAADTLLYFAFVAPL
jgi:hypothetical protein